MSLPLSSFDYTSIKLTQIQEKGNSSLPVRGKAFNLPQKFTLKYYFSFNPMDKEFYFWRKYFIITLSFLVYPGDREGYMRAPFFFFF